VAHLALTRNPFFAIFILMKTGFYNFKALESKLVLIVQGSRIEDLVNVGYFGIDGVQVGLAVRRLYGQKRSCDRREENS